MSDRAVQEIKERLDVAEVIGEYIQVKRAGTSFKAVCPFHSEKSPSFMINRERQIWRCFGCGEGGDLISFVQKFESLTFPETLKVLAAKAGVQLPERAQWTPEQQKEFKAKDDLFEANELAAKFYHEALLRSKSGEVARSYLKKRGVSDDSIKKWQLGFAPNDWHALEEFLKKRGFKSDVLIKAGLLIKGDRGQIYDRFRFRVMFPLHDHHGRIIGFTARALADEEKAKYINSPETPVYTKGSILYGYYFAKQSIRREDAVVIVEGNMDTLSSHQAGVENVVASSGTALTASQLKLLARLTKNLIFAFDQDAAGQTATRRGVELALSMDFNIKIVRMETKDPDDLIKEDPSLWKKAIKGALGYLDFSFQSIFGKIKSTDREAVRKAAYEYLGLVSLISDPLGQAQESKRVAEKLDVPVSSVLDYLKKLSQPKTVSKSGSTATQAQKRKRGRREMIEERVLGLAMASPAFEKLLHQHLTLSDFDTLADVADLVFNKKTEAEGIDWNYKSLDQIKMIGEEDLAQLRAEFTDENKLDKSFVDLGKELKEIAIREEMKSISQQMAEKEENGESAAIEELQERFREISARLSEFNRES